MIEYRVRKSKHKTEWYLNGKLHREDGHAVESVDGSKAWYLDGKRHREDGPAVEYSNGSKHWYLNDQLHREDGPAIELVSGLKGWFLNGQELTEDEFNKRTNKYSGKIIEIDGEKYKLTKI